MDDLAGTVNTLSTAGSTSGQVMTSAGANAAVTWTNMPGMTLLSTTTLSGASTTVSGISQAYKNLYMEIYGMTNATADGTFRIALNGNTLGYIAGVSGIGSVATAYSYTGTYIKSFNTIVKTNADNNFVLTIDNYTSSLNVKPVQFWGFGATASGDNPIIGAGMQYGGAAISSIVLSNTGGNFSSGTIKIYGVN
jgi:hypothetical protein